MADYSDAYQPRSMNEPQTPVEILTAKKRKFESELARIDAQREVIAGKVNALELSINILQGN